MKNQYLYLMVLLFVNCCTFVGQRSPIEKDPKPIIINDVIGDTIDLEERDQYGLFTNINGFVSAKFFDRPDPEKGRKIILVTDNKRYIAMNNDPLTLTMLRDYIEHYDFISVSKAGFEEKWQIVDYDTLGMPITQAEVNQIAKMSPDVKGACFSSAMIFGSLLGCLMGAEEGDEGGADWTFEWIDDAILGSVIGMSIGTIGAIILTKTIETQNRPKALLAIKEMRQPQEME